MSTVLVIDDDAPLCRTLQVQLESHGHRTRSSPTFEAGCGQARTWHPDVILLDVHLPDSEGVGFLPRLLDASPGSVVVVITGDPDNALVSESMKSGALDYLRKPLDLDGLLALLEGVRRRGRASAALEAGGHSGIADDGVSPLVGTDHKIIDLHKQVGLLSRSRVTVLIEGESGTGKELVARMLHEASSPGKHFVAINCSAIVSTLLENELFGHDKGAYTGAGGTMIGKLEYAGEGTVFLDEIGDMPLDLQGKLLRVLQEEEFVRVGGLEPIPLKARSIAATHDDLHSLLRSGKFREDLYYRIAVTRLRIPPLRERKEDFPLLVGHLLAKIGRKLHRPVTNVDGSALARLMDYGWPGNVRELENVLTRAVALASGQILLEDDIASYFIEVTDPAGGEEEDLELAEAEKRHLGRALAKHGWNITGTARSLKISPTTLRKKIADFKLEPARRETDGG